MRNVRFRSRLLAILLAFALVPAVLLTLAWGVAVQQTAPLVSGTSAWERVASTGTRALDAARARQSGPEARQAIAAHERELRTSLEQSRRYAYIARRAAIGMVGLAVVLLALVAVIASRVAGHLSRQLSRPLDEIVGWTDLIARGEAIPEAPPRKGAPEFAVLRSRMRSMSDQIESGKREALEAERLRAFRESARRVAHELKNPLTPIRLAISRVGTASTPEAAEALEVIRTETDRLDRMARAFAQFGRLPEGAHSVVDVIELLRYAASSTVPSSFALDMDVGEGVPSVTGHYDSLAGAFSNVLLNAVEACGSEDSPAVRVRIAAATLDGRPAVRVAITDNGCGIPQSKLGEIWEPYITGKSSGTGLGLAITRQAVLAHGGTVSALSSGAGGGTTVEIILPASSPKRD